MKLYSINNARIINNLQDNKWRGPVSSISSSSLFSPAMRVAMKVVDFMFSLCPRVHVSVQVRVRQQQSSDTVCTTPSNLWPLFSTWACHSATNRWICLCACTASCLLTAKLCHRYHDCCETLYAHSLGAANETLTPFFYLGLSQHH